MKPAETKRIYEQAARSRRMEPEEAEARVWHRTLRDFDVRDVEAAVDAWWASTERRGDGELKSRWLPAPAELKPLVIAAQKKREVAAQEPTDFVIWHCFACGHGGQSGTTKKGLGERRNCPYCSKPMHEVSRWPNNYKPAA